MIRLCLSQGRITWAQMEDDDETRKKQELRLSIENTITCMEILDLWAAKDENTTQWNEIRTMTQRFLEMWAAALPQSLNK